MVLKDEMYRIGKQIRKALDGGELPPGGSSELLSALMGAFLLPKDAQYTDLVNAHAVRAGNVPPHPASTRPCTQLLMENQSGTFVCSKPTEHRSQLCREHYDWRRSRLDKYKEAIDDLRTRLKQAEQELILVREPWDA